ncbi:MAG: shikimate kinase [Lautropia sp.]
MDAALSIFLIGMMGAGKSTVGVRLARLLDRPFVDVDRELEHRLGVDIPTIFDLEGEAGFRRREAALIDELTQRPGLVIATGGGAVTVEANRSVLARRGLVVYLRPGFGDLWHRLRRDRHRPMLKSPDPRARIEALIAERDPLYLAIADHVVASGRQHVEQTVDAIAQWLDGPDCAERTACKKSLSI